MITALIIEDWVLEAACGKHDNPDLWFGNSRSAHIAAAAICNTCPVQTRCLDEALTHHIEYGIWGGLNATDRAKLARCIRCGKPAGARLSNTTRGRLYCTTACRVAANRERLDLGEVTVKLPPQPTMLATCIKCSGRFEQTHRPNLTCPTCRPRRRTGGAQTPAPSPAAPPLASRTSSGRFVSETDQLPDERVG